MDFRIHASLIGFVTVVMSYCFFGCRIFADVAGDITIVVDGESFLLHKVKTFKMRLTTT